MTGMPMRPPLPSLQVSGVNVEISCLKAAALHSWRRSRFSHPVYLVPTAKTLKHLRLSLAIETKIILL